MRTDWDERRCLSPPAWLDSANPGGIGWKEQWSPDAHLVYHCSLSILSRNAKEWRPTILAALRIGGTNLEPPIQDMAAQEKL
jgi:hypothetical protein